MSLNDATMKLAARRKSFRESHADEYDNLRNATAQQKFNQDALDSDNPTGHLVGGGTTYREYIPSPCKRKKKNGNQ